MISNWQFGLRGALVVVAFLGFSGCAVDNTTRTGQSQPVSNYSPTVNDIPDTASATATAVQAAY